jgi:hypothetical protein
MQLFLVTSLLFVLLAILGAFDAASASLSLLPWFNGLRWLRVHLITLGVITEAAFGVLPVLLAGRSGQTAPRPRLDIWLALNAGLLTLLVGIPMINQTIIIAGGGLVFLATVLLIHQLWTIRRRSSADLPVSPSPSRKFYLAGLAYFLFGIFVGTGMWLGWNQALGMRNATEVHIHANNWGLLSLVFAGLLIDLFPAISGQDLASGETGNRIFGLMTLGAFGLVLGPWTGWIPFTVVGLVLHIAGTITLLVKVTESLRARRVAWTAGILHLVVAYFWILAPVFVAPLVLFDVQGFAASGIEQNVPQALVYGWVLQFGYALLPFLFARSWLGPDEAELGGTWYTLLMVNLGCVFLWASIFILPVQAVLHGIAYAFWGLSMLPILRQLWRIGRRGNWGLPPTPDFETGGY